MKIRIAAAGRLRSGPEKDLFTEYQTRLDRTGRPLGLGPLDLVEIEAKNGGQAAEADLLARAANGFDRVVALDERGKLMTSPEFSKHLADWRDQGVGGACFVIGGADGLTAEMRAKADLSLSFGKMVWPHMLARVMLAEQLYRAASILGGSPYHRA